MHNYQYKNTDKMLIPEIVRLLTQIHEFKGMQTLFVGSKADTLTQLMEIAKIQSTESSNKIEGISTSNERLKKLVKDKTTPKNRNEEEIAGYRDVLHTIHENYDHIPVKPAYILQLHKDLYKFSGSSIGGSYKSSNNVIAEEHADGTKTVRFEPVEAWLTPQAMNELCTNFNEALELNETDSLILIPMFILDFLCIHPFHDGNGRMSRLLTLLLLYRSGYIVGKYVSIERIIEQSKESYYEVLKSSSEDFHENNNNYLPFVRYMLGVIVAAYREFEERVEVLVLQGYSKPERIAEMIKSSLGKITKAEILENCPDISETTISRTLNELTKQGKILKTSGGRYTSYIWNREDE